MSQPLHSRLHPLPRAFPGAALALAPDGPAESTNGVGGWFRLALPADAGHVRQRTD